MSNGISELLRQNLIEAENDKQEACVGCGTVWYAIHHKDGLCHKCQQAGRPNRSAIQRRMARLATAKKLLRWAISLGSLTGLAYLLFN